jgi:hypothetical protein
MARDQLHGMRALVEGSRTGLIGVDAFYDAFLRAISVVQDVNASNLDARYLDAYYLLNRALEAYMQDGSEVAAGNLLEASGQFVKVAWPSPTPS